MFKNKIWNEMELNYPFLSWKTDIFESFINICE